MAMKSHWKSAAGAAFLLSCCLPQSSAAGAEAQQPLDALSGQMLSAVDGSTITLQPTEDGMTRVLIAPDGRVERTHFSFLGAKLGVVSDGHDPNRLLGVFREGDGRIQAQFADGHDEVLTASADGGLKMTISADGGARTCMAWYPKGHLFSDAQKQAALAAYATRLGVALPGAKTAPAPNSCEEPLAQPGAPGAVQAAGQSAPVTAQPEAPKGPPSLADTAAHLEKTGTLHAAHGKEAAALTPILVRTSVVHPIDTPASALADMSSAGGSEAAVANEGPAASSCLSVDSDGKHWGFRNTCGYPVQFVYCLKDGGDPLTSCSNGSVAGSVASEGFAALSVDKTLGETDANHDFRWVACRGGAGEVVPRLDRTSPPAGRCIRSQES
jgi:hypothetical protein